MKKNIAFLENVKKQKDVKACRVFEQVWDYLSRKLLRYACEMKCTVEGNNN